MKAIVCKKSGSTKVLQFKEIEKPSPKDHEILIKVQASSVTRGDVALRKIPRLVLYPMGFLFGFKPMDITGVEFSGMVEDTGNNVSLFKKGDFVFGTTTGLKYGANAEYVCVPEKWKMGVVAIKPSNLSFAESAVVPVGGMTALHILKKGNIKNGQNVLVYGASGSVGTYAVQLAKHMGAEVTGICSTKNLELVKSIGADKVIDYTKEDFTKNNIKYDVIFDAVGVLWKSQCNKVLKPNGQFLSVRYPTSEKTEYLDYLRDLLERGKIKPVIDRSFLLEEIAEAHRYVESGRKKGNVVITNENSKK
jgi:NADPH:quinone reductase-like Zn-dependent oxidoreductase